MPERSEGRGAWGPDALPAVRCGGGYKKTPDLSIGGIYPAFGLVITNEAPRREQELASDLHNSTDVRECQGEIPAPPKGAGGGSPSGPPEAGNLRQSSRGAAAEGAAPGGVSEGAKPLLAASEPPSGSVQGVQGAAAPCKRSERSERSGSGVEGRQPLYLIIGHY